MQLKHKCIRTTRRRNSQSTINLKKHKQGFKQGKPRFQ